MPHLKKLSGKEVVRIFEAFGFDIFSQRGSHVKLRRVLPGAVKETLTIPNHAELDSGTLRAIYRQALRYVSDNDLRVRFYTE